MTDSEIKAHYDEVNKLQSELTSALASRDYYKELAEAADKVIEAMPTIEYNKFMNSLKQYHKLKQSK